MTTSENVIPTLLDYNIPPKVKVIPANTLEDLFVEAGRRSMMGYTGNVFSEPPSFKDPGSIHDRLCLSSRWSRSRRPTA